MLLIFALVPVIIAVLLYISPFEKMAKWFAVIGQTCLSGFAFFIFMSCKSGDILTRIGNYEGFLGILLKADTLTSVFLMLTSFIFLLGTVYCFNEKYSRLFWFLLFLWQGLLNGVFLSNDVFNIFVLVEVSTVVVAVLIMFNRDNRSMYDGMLYLMVNIVAMQFYLFGAGYLYKLTGTLDMTATAQALGRLDKPSLILPFALIMTSICLKCALVPLFSWLPRAHGTPGAPSAVSAILSGLHIKSGVYLFIRFQAVFAEASLHEFFLIVGIITGVIGALLALSQTDVKLILAYSTISQIGMIMIGLNASDIYAYTGGVYHIFNHALFKSALFLCAGIITYAYGTRDITRIRGVLRRYPLVGVATILAILGITGTPLFNGSISKYFITAGVSWPIQVPAILINLGTITVFIKYSTMLFKSPVRQSVGSPEHTEGSTRLESDSSEQHVSTQPACQTIDKLPEKLDICQQIVVLILGALCFAGGVFGERSIEFLFGASVDVDAAGYAEKTGLFALSVIVGYLLFRYFVDKHPLFSRIRGIDMDFRWICASIGGFFAATLIALFVTYG